MRQIKFNFAIKYNHRYGINQKRYSCLSILMRITSNTSKKCKANNLRINEFYDSSNYKHLKCKVDEKLFPVILKYIQKCRTPPSMIKLIVDNAEVPDFIIQESSRDISAEIRNLHKEYVIRFKFVQQLQDVGCPI